jgi:hypothetical protein
MLDSREARKFENNPKASMRIEKQTTRMWTAKRLAMAMTMTMTMMTIRTPGQERMKTRT